MELLLAIRRGDAEALVSELVEGANVDLGDEDEMTPLMYAAYKGDVGVLCTLLAAEANAARRDSMGRTALMHAAAAWKKDACKALLAADAQVDTEDMQGRTPLMHAVSSSDGCSASEAVAAHEVCEELVRFGAAVNHQDPNGCTPLLLAALAGSVALVPLLLEARADPTLVDAEGGTAAEYAQAEGHEQVADLIAAAGKAEEMRLSGERQKGRCEDARAEALAALAGGPADMDPIWTIDAAD